MKPTPQSHFYFPAEQSEWLNTPKGERYALRRGASAGGPMAGAALLQCGPDPAVEQQTQTDFSAGVDELIAMRGQEGCENMVISGAKIKNFFQRKTPTRARFGLLNHNDPKYGNEDGGVNAAKTCHRSILWAICLANLRVVHPRFDSTQGMQGLSEWSQSVKLVRLFPAWLLLLPLLLLLFLIGGCPISCESPPPPPDSPFQTRSWVLVIDKSGSMEDTIQWAKDELELYLDWMIEEQDSWDSWAWWHDDYYANIIAYDDDANPLFDGLKVVNRENGDKMLEFLVQQRDNVGGGTNLESGMKEAAKQVSVHGKPSTLFVVTDADDNSISQMLDVIKEVDSGDAPKDDPEDPRPWFEGYFDPFLQGKDRWLEVDDEQPALFMNCKTTDYMKLEVEKYDADQDGRLSKTESDQAFVAYKSSKDNGDPSPISWSPNFSEERLIDLCKEMNGDFKAGRPDLTIPFNFVPWLWLAGLLVVGSLGYFFVRSRMRST